MSARWKKVGFAALAGLVVLKLAVAAGAPAALLSWALLVVAIGVVALAWLRRGDVPWLDPSRAALLVVGLACLPSVYPLLGGDGYEYYVLLRSPLLDGDLSLANDFEGFHYRAVTAPGGEPTSRVQIGTALFWAPLVIAAHAGAKLAHALGVGLEPDGFSPLYQSAATLSTFLYGFAALLLLESRLRRHYGAAVALLSTLGLLLATPLHFYLVANPFMSHGVSVFAATVFVLAWLRAREAEAWRPWLLAGVAGGLMCLVRAHDGVLLLPPLVDLALRRPPGRAARIAGVFLAVPAVLALVQAAVWWRLYGAGFVGATAQMNFLTPLTPHVTDLLLSPRHGLFTWTPLYLLAALGWVLWLRRDPRLALLFLLGFALSVFLNSLFKDWWGSQSFGQRRLLSLTPLFALGLGEAVAFLARRPLVPLSAALAALVLWTLQFEYVYQSELVASKREAVSLDGLVAAQVDVLNRRLLAWEDRLPPGLWALVYDNLKGVWLDEGPRTLRGRVDLGEEQQPLPFLIGAGWYKAEQEQGVRFRRSRGAQSTLRLPIRSPGDLRATLRARLELTGAPVSVSLEVNGEEVGRAELDPGWRDYGFDVPARSLVPGLNTFLFRYSATPRGVDPAVHGKNAVVAVAFLKLDRREEPPTDRRGSP